MEWLGRSSRPMTVGRVAAAASRRRAGRAKRTQHAANAVGAIRLRLLRPTLASKVMSLPLNGPLQGGGEEFVEGFRRRHAACAGGERWSIARPPAATAAHHAAPEGPSRCRRLRCRSPGNWSAQPSHACRERADPVELRMLRQLRRLGLDVVFQPLGRVRIVIGDGRRSPTNRRGRSPATQSPARRFLSIRACASSMTCRWGIAGRASSMASRTFARNQAS
jgi:hypothetical protein